MIADVLFKPFLAMTLLIVQMGGGSYFPSTSIESANGNEKHY